MAKFKIGNACKKCGERGASVRYDTIPGLEVMHRVCKLCGYSWVEEPHTQTSEKNLADSSQAVQQTHEAISLLEYIDELLRSIGQINEGSPVHKRINAVLAKQHHA